MRYPIDYDHRRGNIDCVYRYRVHVLLTGNDGADTSYREFFKEKQDALDYVHFLSNLMSEEEKKRTIIVKEFV